MLGSGTQENFNRSGPSRLRRPRNSGASHTWGDAAMQSEARRAIEKMVTDVFGVEHAALARRTRGARRIALARQVAMYVAHVNCGLTLTDVGRLFGRDRTTVAHACLSIEMRRDEQLFDRVLDLLGWAAPAIVRRPHNLSGAL
jgi:hypothetical protein